MNEPPAPDGLAWGKQASPVGDLYVACSANGVALVSFGPPAGWDLPSAPPPARAQTLLAEALRQLADYFAGRCGGFSIPVDWSDVPATHREVLQALQQSARHGQTVTYGELARRAGLAGGGDFPPARVVGQVMGANRCPIVVPCHRVVAGDGLGGYSGGSGIEVKRWLLIFEGALPPTLDWDPAGPSVGQPA